MRPKRLSAEEITQIKFLEQQGHSGVHIADVLGRQKSTVHYHLEGKPNSEVAALHRKVKALKAQLTVVRKKKECESLLMENHPLLAPPPETPLTRLLGRRGDSRRLGDEAEDWTRLVLRRRGYRFYMPGASGDAVDLVVRVSTDRGFAPIQIRTAYERKHGAPTISLTRTYERERISLNLDEYDFFIGFLPRTITFYVIPINDIKQGRAKIAFTCRAKYANAFHLLPAPA